MRVAELARAGGPMWAVHTMCSACGGVANVLLLCWPPPRWSVSSVCFSISHLARQIRLNKDLVV